MSVCVPLLRLRQYLDQDLLPNYANLSVSCPLLQAYYIINSYILPTFVVSLVVSYLCCIFILHTEMTLLFCSSPRNNRGQIRDPGISHNRWLYTIHVSLIYTLFILCKLAGPLITPHFIQTSHSIAEGVAVSIPVAHDITGTIFWPYVVYP